MMTVNDDGSIVVDTSHLTDEDINRIYREWEEQFKGLPKEEDK